MTPLKLLLAVTFLSLCIHLPANADVKFNGCHVFAALFAFAGLTTSAAGIYYSVEAQNSTPNSEQGPPQAFLGLTIAFAVISACIFIKQDPVAILTTILALIFNGLAIWKSFTNYDDPQLKNILHNTTNSTSDQSDPNIVKTLEFSIAAFGTNILSGFFGELETG